jgi:hypothetical protein
MRDHDEPSHRGTTTSVSSSRASQLSQGRPEDAMLNAQQPNNTSTHASIDLASRKATVNGVLQTRTTLCEASWAGTD